MTKRRFPSWLKYAVLLLVFALVVSYNQQSLDDWYRLYHYSPSPDVKALADNTTMTNSGRRLFYIYHPKIEDKSDFATNCNVNETIVLGCYVSRLGIYIYHVSNQQLQGIQEVTAAHEMLHVAYERLSVSEKQNVDKMTEQVFAATTDQRIIDTIESYRKQDPTVVDNELHSILGTEVRSLPPELENYYSRYFTNRLAIVTYSEGYQKAFADIQNQVAEIDTQMKTLKTTIEAYETSLTKQGGDLNAQYQSLQQLKQGGDTASYNAQAKLYNQKVSAYNRNLEDYKAKITAYNDLVNQRNQLTDKQQSLVNAIDTRAAPAAN